MDLVKKFIAYYKPHKGLFFLDMSCALGIASLDLLFPIFSRTLLNDFIPDRNLRAIIIASLVMFVLYVLKGVFYYIVNYWGHVLGVRMEYDMRKKLFEHFQIMDVSFFDNRRTGKLMSRIVNDLNLIAELAHHGPEDLFLSVILFIGSFIILLTIEVKLTLIIFAFLPFMLWFSIVKGVKMRGNFRQVRKKVADVNSNIENSISGVRVAKSFTNEEYELEKFDEGNIHFRNSKQDAYKTMAEFHTGINFSTNFLNLLTIALGGYFVYIGNINYGDLIAFILYINFFMEPIKRLTNFTQQFQDGMSGFERFLEILDIPPKIKDIENPIELKDVKGNINIKNVEFAYDDDDESKVLHNIDIDIQAGTTMAIVGPSGGGKTTLCHLIPRFYDVTKGRITIDGVDIKDASVKSLRKNIGLVQQSVFLFTGTIKENIKYGNIDATDEEVVEAAKHASIHDFIMSLPNRYDTYIGERGVKLSGGQQQRISIARIFLKNPPILILDEATSALDNATEILIQKSLEKLSRGRTTLVIAHRLSTIQNADEIIVLTDKGIQERGNHKTLLEKAGVYANLYNSQFSNFMNISEA
ncbi:MAG: ABC transporter ATP-binding protein [Bacillota bacterium]|nr:ABC transporter ATP-binding protein [Bacillota bacterium]